MSTIASENLRILLRMKALMAVDKRLGLDRLAVHAAPLAAMDVYRVDRAVYALRGGRLLFNLLLELVRD